MTPDHANSPRFFYGLQPRWLSWDRFYRVYVSEQMIAGAYVAGQFYDAPSTALQLHGLYLFLYPLVRYFFARRRQREALYDEIDPFEPLLLSQDPRNFQILRSEIVRACFRRNRSLWAPLNVGTVEIKLHDGTKRRLILVGDQEPEAVLELMRVFDPATEVTGKPSPRPRPRQLSPTSTRYFFVVLAALLLGFGALFGYAAITGIGPAAMHGVLAVVNVAFGGWCLVKAWRVSRAPPESKRGARDEHGPGT